MAPPLPGHPRTTGKIAGAVALAFTSMPGSASAQSPAPATQRPSAAPPTLPAEPDPGAATNSNAEPAPAPAPAPEATSWDAAPAPGPDTEAPAQWEDEATAPAIDESDLPPENPGADDEDDRLLRPTAKRFFFQLNAGGSGRMGGMPSYAAYYSYYYGFGGGGFNSNFELVVGGFGKRERKKGRRVGGAFVYERSFGSFGSTLLGGRVVIDTPFSDKWSLSSTHQVTIGIKASYPSLFGVGVFSPYALYGLQASVEYGWGVSAIVAERLSLSFRPANFEVASGPFGLLDVNYSVMGGVGVVW